MLTQLFGVHLTLDFYNCPENKLDDMLLCYNSLENCAKEIGMKMLTLPSVVMAKGTDDTNSKDPGGFSGFVIIEESHISIHTFPKRGYVSIDVYSCRYFDTSKATNFFKSVFKPLDIETNTLDRGKKYPSANIY